MYKFIDERFEEIIKVLKNNFSPTELAEKAYDYAKMLHKDQIRKDGTPYLSHPVEVAYILVKLGFDQDVISAALLHDVVEDCNYTVDSLKKEFNKNIAEMVDCVSAIDKEKFIFDEDDLFESENFEKASIEEQSFKKLVSIGKNNPLGFCIKFADRLHNLTTIDCFDYNKQLEKVKETEKWIIPIAKILNAEYFYRELKNECFKIINKYNGSQFLMQYNNYHKINSTNIDKLFNKLKEVLSTTIIKNIEIKDIKEYKVYNSLSAMFKNINISKVSQGQILKVANYNISLLYQDGTYADALKQVWEILKSKAFNEYKIIDATIGKFTKMPYFLIEDKYKNKFNLSIYQQAEYTNLQLGTLGGQIKDLIDDYNIDNLSTELIKVKTRSDEIKYLPKGSTVLDFAFKIHKDIGFSFKYAIINNSKTKAPPYTKLYDGDKIEIITNRNENGQMEYCEELRWLAYINSDYAKKILIRHFERKLENK